MKNAIRNLSLKAKITLTVGIILVIGTIYLLLCTDNALSESAQKGANNTLSTYLSAQSNNIYSYISDTEDKLLLFSKSNTVKQLLKNKNDSEAFNEAQANTKNYFDSLKTWEGLYIGEWETTKALTFPDKKIIGKRFRTEKEKIDELHTSMENAQNGVFNTGIIVSPATGKLVMSLYAPVYDDKKIIGYVGGGDFSSHLQNILQRITITGYEHAKFSMVNVETKMNIINEDESLLAKVTTDPIHLQVLDKISKNELEGQFKYEDNGVTTLISYKMLQDKGWVAITTDSDNEIFAAEKSNQKFVIILAIVAVIVVLISSYIVITVLTKPLNIIEKAIIKMGKLDLTKTKELDSFCDSTNETGNISNAIEKLRTILTDIVTTLEGSSKSLNESANTMTDEADTLSTYVTENASTTHSLVSDLNSTTEIIRKISNTIERLDNMVEDIQSMVSNNQEESYSLLTNARHMEESTSDALNHSAKNIDQNREKINYAGDKLNELSQIDTLVSNILNISNQTKLLSLNASIEAARAGKAGKGFTIVAQQIGNLAQGSAVTVSNIQGICGNIDDIYTSVNSCFEKVIDYLETSVITQYQDLATKSKENREIASQMTNRCMAIETDVKKFKTYYQEMLRQMYNIQNAVNNNEYAVSNIVTKNNQTSDIADKIQNISNINKDEANKLSKIIKQFSL